MLVLDPITEVALLAVLEPAYSLHQELWLTQIHHLCRSIFWVHSALPVRF
jgi:hypothetical protein